MEKELKNKLLEICKRNKVYIDGEIYLRKFNVDFVNEKEECFDLDIDFIIEDDDCSYANYQQIIKLDLLEDVWNEAQKKLLLGFEEKK